MIGSTVIHINSEWLTLASGTLVPLVVAFIAKLNASSGLKSLLNALLSAVAGALSTALAAGGSIQWQLYLVNIGLAWVASIATYYGLWKPTSTAIKLSNATKNFGFGRAPRALANPPGPSSPAT